MTLTQKLWQLMSCLVLYTLQQENGKMGSSTHVLTGTCSWRHHSQSETNSARIQRRCQRPNYCVFLCFGEMKCGFRPLVAIERLEAGQDASRQKSTSLNDANSTALKGKLFSPQAYETSHISPISLRLMTYFPVIITEIGHYYIKCSHFAVSGID